MNNPFNIVEIDNTIIELEEYYKKIKQLKKESSRLFKNALSTGCKSIFKEYGELINSITWTQYTPYWNDGDATEFGVYDLYVDFKNTPVNQEYVKLAFENELNNFDEYDRGCRLFENKNRDLFDKLNFIEKLKEEYPDECLELFGNHVKVIITAEEILVEDYDHD